MGRCSVWDRIRVEAGTMVDYERLSGFHYRGTRPVGVMRVLVARWSDGATQRRSDEGVSAGVVVECRPVLNCALRGVALGGRYGGKDRGLAAVLLNREVRTIARVVVHPMFRGIGVGTELVREVLRRAETRFVEALAVMGRVNGFFEAAGMRRFERPMGKEAVRLLAAVQEWSVGGEQWSGVSGQWSETGAAEVLRRLRVEDVEGSAFLARELRRFARGKVAGAEAWLREARERALSWPVYYLWDREWVTGINGHG